MAARVVCFSSFVPITSAGVSVPEDINFNLPPDVCDVLPMCLMCGGKMEMVFDLPNMKVCVCVDCRTGITVPAKAWAVGAERARVKSAKPFP